MGKVKGQQLTEISILISSTSLVQNLVEAHQHVQLDFFLAAHCIRGC